MLVDFSYVYVPKLSGDIKEDAESVLCANNKRKTFEHSVAVGDTNAEIAVQYKLDMNICELCGYLHDISAVIAPDDMLLYAERNSFYIDEAERKYPFLLHQRISRLIAEQDLGVTDERVLSAIECHSTLKSNPSLYDMALFVADKLSWDQDGTPPFYESVKNSLAVSLEAASIAYMEYIIEHNMILYPHRWFNEGKESIATKPCTQL